MAYVGNQPFGKTVRTTTSETLTSVKTAFYPSGGYTVGYVDVYLNGSKLAEVSDYTATNGSLVTLLFNPEIGDTVEIITYGSVEIANAVRRSGDTMTGNLTINANLVVNGTTSISGSGASLTALNATNISSGTLATPRLPAGTVLQVVQTKQPASNFSTSSTTFVDVTGISLSITPSSASNKILVFIGGGQNGLYSAAAYNSSYNLVRNGTQLAENLGAVRDSGNQNAPCTMVYLDSPATTSAITYKMQAKVSGSGSVQVYGTTDMLTITAMEIAA